MNEPTPHEPDATPHSLREGVHDLRNVLNAVQMNAYAARKLVEEPARTLACITRIEAAVQKGNGVLAHLPTEETLSTATLVLRDRLHDVEVTCEGDPDSPVPGLLRQALCVVAVESHALGARAFHLRVEADGHATLACDARGLQTPGPIAQALNGSRVADLHVAATRSDGGWTFRWVLPPPQ